MFHQELKAAGLRTTNPRKKVLTLLKRYSQRHMSAEEVYKSLWEDKQEIALATVYRVLTQFHKAGLVKRHNFAEGHFVFELDHGSHHDHLVCVKCGKIAEFFDAAIEASQLSVTRARGFQMLDHALTIYGICSHCSSYDTALSKD